MVKIRLMRVGKRKQPSYRVVVADSRSPRDGRILEAIGHYNPRHEPSIVAIDTDRAVYWLSQGAQPSNQARKLLEITGAWATFRGEPLPPSALQAATAAAEPGKPAPPPVRATPAASVRATPAASVDEPSPDEVEGEATPAELPEAVDQAPAAPDAPAEE